MRIGFVLMNDDDDDTGLLKVEFLGGYWKLPLAPVHSGDPQARCVSNRRSGTLPVPAHELDDVYSELRPVLPKIFAYEQYGPQAYMPKYKGEVFMSVYCLIRGAAEARARKHKNAHALLVNAEDLLVASDSRLRRPLLKHGSSPGPTSVPMRALVAYWLRQAGIERQCTGAPDTQRVVATAACFQRALELHPWNAGAEYLLGLIAISKGELEDARVHFVRSLRIDPEFKALYICLGSVALTLGDLDDAVRISEVGLRRYPQAFQCYYNLGLALARQLSKQLHARPTGGGRGHEGTCQDLQGLASRSVGQLRQAKQEHQVKLWCASDDAILKTLEAIVVALGRGGGAAAIDRPADSDRELYRELATQLLCAKGWTLETFRP